MIDQPNDSLLQNATPSRSLISHRDIARNIRFQHNNPDMSACWVWTGPTHRTGHPTVAATGHSARQDVYERIRGYRPGGHLKPGCGINLCVNPGHMRGTIECEVNPAARPAAAGAPETAATPASAATEDTSSAAPRDPR